MVMDGPETVTPSPLIAMSGQEIIAPSPETVVVREALHANGIEADVSPNVHGGSRVLNGNIF